MKEFGLVQIYLVGHLLYQIKISIDKSGIKALFDESSEIKSTFNIYSSALEKWWSAILPDLENLPETNNVFDLYNKFSKSFVEALQVSPFGGDLEGACAILDNFQSRGALASYWNELTTDLKSVASSGWNAELIPDDEILESQFPDVLKELRTNEARKEELEALFKEVNDLEDGVWNEDDYEVWPKDELKELKDAIKELKGKRKEAVKEHKNLLKRIKANEKAAKKDITASAEIPSLTASAEKFVSEIKQLDELIVSDELRFAKHIELEDELKQCKRVIREIKDRKQNLVDQARLLISP